MTRARTGSVALNQASAVTHHQKAFMKPVQQLLLKGTVACLLALAVVSTRTHAADHPAESGAVTAIDILLEPDATMLRHSASNNARLLGVFPKGFTLDATHTPHITLLQCFALTAELDRLYAAAGRVIAGAKVTTMKLEAFKYYFAPAGAVGVAGICARPTPAILRLQADIVAAVKPYLADSGSIGAFTAPHDDAATDAALIQYVSTFSSKLKETQHPRHLGRRHRHWNISHNNRGMMGYQTPNIDRIAKEGVAFTDYYASRAAPPVAPPSSAAPSPSAPA
jgi:hypothetical protein